MPTIVTARPKHSALTDFADAVGDVASRAGSSEGEVCAVPDEPLDKDFSFWSSCPPAHAPSPVTTMRAADKASTRPRRPSKHAHHQARGRFHPHSMALPLALTVTRANKDRCVQTDPPIVVPPPTMGPGRTLRPPTRRSTQAWARFSQRSTDGGRHGQAATARPSPTPPRRPKPRWSRGPRRRFADRRHSAKRLGSPSTKQWRAGERGVVGSSAPARLARLACPLLPCPARMVASTSCDPRKAWHVTTTESIRRTWSRRHSSPKALAPRDSHDRSVRSCFIASDPAPGGAGRSPPARCALPARCRPGRSRSRPALKARTGAGCRRGTGRLRPTHRGVARPLGCRRGLPAANDPGRASALAVGGARPGEVEGVPSYRSCRPSRV